MFKYMLLCCFFILVGCESSNSPRIQALNKTTLSSEGQFVGILPDGRSVYRYQIERGIGVHNHWLYVTDNSITTNHSHRETDDDSTKTVDHATIFVEEK